MIIDISPWKILLEEVEHTWRIPLDFYEFENTQVESLHGGETHTK
jgi:hypothetical protein